jgi:hypothetical protein
MRITILMEFYPKFTKSQVDHEFSAHECFLIGSPSPSSCDAVLRSIPTPCRPPPLHPRAAPPAIHQRPRRSAASLPCRTTAHCWAGRRPPNVLYTPENVVDAAPHDNPQNLTSTQPRRHAPPPAPPPALPPPLAATATPPRPPPPNPGWRRMSSFARP